jgi:glucosylceramidase
MKGKNYIVSLLIFVTMINCKGVNNAFEVTVYETSANKNSLTKVNQFST